MLGVITSRNDVRTAALSFVLRYFPAKLDFVASQLEALQRSRVTLGVFGVVALTWASLGFFSAVSTAVNYAWKVERQRSYLKHKLVAFLMMATACALLILTVFVIQRLAGGWRVLVRRGGRPLSEIAVAARRVGQLGRHLLAHDRRRPDLLLRAEREGPFP